MNWDRFTHSRKTGLALKKEFERAVQLDPNLATAHLHLGLVKRAQDDKSGMPEIQQAAQLAPQNTAIAMELGKALVAGGKDEQANSDLPACA